MQWISVNDRLPEEATPVLVLHKGERRIGEICWDYPSWEETYQAFRYWDCPYNDGQGWEVFDITHWMPLPEPPTVTTEDKE